jgi:hypothetical protein
MLIKPILPDLNNVVDVIVSYEGKEEKVFLIDTSTVYSFVHPQLGEPFKIELLTRIGGKQQLTCMTSR